MVGCGGASRAEVLRLVRVPRPAAHDGRDWVAAAGGGWMQLDAGWGSELGIQIGSVVYQSIRMNTGEVVATNQGE